MTGEGEIKERRMKGEERGERRMDLTCHVDVISTLNDHFNTI